MKFIFFFFFFLITGCNFLEDYADQNSEKALLFRAKDYLNKRNYTKAIETFEKLKSQTLSRPDVLYQYASAYAGRCGLEFIPFVSRMSSTTSHTLFSLLFDAMPKSQISQADDCQAAEALLMNMGALPQDRTEDQNWLLSFVEFSKIGVILNSHGDLDQDNGLDSAFDPCNSLHLSDDRVKQIILSLNTGMLSLIEAISQANSQLAPYADQYTQACQSLSTIDPQLNFCSRTRVEDISTFEVKGMRTLIHEGQSLGLGTCNSSDLASCVCL